MMNALETLLSPVASLGRRAIAAIGEMGAFILFACRGLWHMASLPAQISKTVHQVYFIGAKSVSVIALIGLFTGMVLGLQGYYTLVKFGAEGLLGAAVALSAIRELGPVLTAIMVTGRAGSAMAAEIGSITVNTPLCAAGMVFRPVIHSHTVHMQAARA